MQAIILAAGMGKRLGHLTEDRTKCMVEVNGVALIDRMLAQLDEYNLSRIVIVVGYQSQKLIDYISQLSVTTPIVYVENSIYDKTNNIYSLYLAKNYLVEDDTLLFESDLIVEDDVIKLLVDNDYPDLALVAKYESWMDGTVVTLDDDNNIVRFIPNKSFCFDEIPDYFKTVNIYKFSKDFSTKMYVPFLEAYSMALGDNEYYEQVLRVITLLDKPSIKALPLTNEHWYEIDDIQDLDIAESIFASDDDAYHKITNRYGGYWRYPQILDFCYLVNPYFPNDRLVAEIQANFDKLLRNYPSGLSVNNLLAAKDFNVDIKYLTVGNGAAELIKSLIEHTSGKVGIIRPTFEEYPNRLSPDMIVPFDVASLGYQYSVNDIISFYSDKDISRLVLINPDNPTGNFIPFHDVMLLCEWCEKRSVSLVLDESFVDFAEHSFTLLNNDMLSAYPHLVVIKSISKSFGVPGLRLGLLATADYELLDYIRKDISIWNINSFAEFYLQIYGKYEADYKQACAMFVAERNRFVTKLKSIGWLTVLDSQANFLMCRIDDKYTSAQLCRLLLKRFNILIKDCSKKTGGQNFIRIAVRNEEDNNRLVNSLYAL